jgi:hypothetical protein
VPVYKFVNLKAYLLKMLVNCNLIVRMFHRNSLSSYGPTLLFPLILYCIYLFILLAVSFHTLESYTGSTICLLVHAGEACLRFQYIFVTTYNTNIYLFYSYRKFVQKYRKPRSCQASPNDGL